jgi:hypothetical protein
VRNAGQRWHTAPACVALQLLRFRGRFWWPPCKLWQAQAPCPSPARRLPLSPHPLLCPACLDFVSCGYEAAVLLLHRPVWLTLPLILPCCRSESVTMNNFFSSADGQLELLAQGALDSVVSSTGALHALRPRLGHFHQLLLEPPKVGDVGIIVVLRGGGDGREDGPRKLSLPCICSWSPCR